MTSSTRSFLFLSFMFSSFGLVDPTALKVRITNHALNMLRDEALVIFQEHVEGQVFESFQFYNCKFSNVRLTGVNVNQAHLSFVENYGFRFVIQNFGFTLNFDATVNLCPQLGMSREFIFTGAAVNMEVGLARNENGRLAADMRACQASADQIGFVGAAQFGNLQKRVEEKVVAYLISNKLCPYLKDHPLADLNRKLNSIPMVAPLPLDLGINFDYTLTRDIQVTATSLDMAFNGLAYRQLLTVEEKVVEPVFTENTLMAYVGISEFFFNSAVRCLYEAGSLTKDFDRINSRAMKAALRVKQFFTQPWNLDQPLKGQVELTEAPTISITQRDGFIFNMRIRVKVIAPEARTPDVLSVSAVCPVSMMVTIERNRLTLPSKDINCKIKTSNGFTKVLVVPLNKLINNEATKFLSGWFGEGVEIPIPPEINFIQGNIRYEDGYVVVGGDLRSTPAGRQRVAEMVKGPGR